MAEVKFEVVNVSLLLTGAKHNAPVQTFAIIRLSGSSGEFLQLDFSSAAVEGNIDEQSGGNLAVTLPLDQFSSTKQAIDALRASQSGFSVVMRSINGALDYTIEAV